MHCRPPAPGPRHAIDTHKQKAESVERPWSDKQPRSDHDKPTNTQMNESSTRAGRHSDPTQQLTHSHQPAEAQEPHDECEPVGPREQQRHLPHGNRIAKPPKASTQKNAPARGTRDRGAKGCPLRIVDHQLSDSEASICSTSSSLGAPSPAAPSPAGASPSPPMAACNSSSSDFDPTTRSRYSR